MIACYSRDDDESQFTLSPFAQSIARPTLGIKIPGHSTKTWLSRMNQPHFSPLPHTIQSRSVPMVIIKNILQHHPPFLGREEETNPRETTPGMRQKPIILCHTHTQERFCLLFSSFPVSPVQHPPTSIHPCQVGDVFSLKLLCSFSHKRRVAQIQKQQCYYQRRQTLKKRQDTRRDHSLI